MSPRNPRGKSVAISARHLELLFANRLSGGTSVSEAPPAQPLVSIARTNSRSMTARLGGVGESYSCYDFTFGEARDTARRNSDHEGLPPSGGGQPFPKELQNSVLACHCPETPIHLGTMLELGFVIFKTVALKGIWTLDSYRTDRVSGTGMSLRVYSMAIT